MDGKRKTAEEKPMNILALTEDQGMLLHLVGVDDDVGGGVDGEEDVVDLDEDHHPGRVLLKPTILHHLHQIVSLP